jgi:Zn finger protein HypA/HybF involved in hydrogenase expression
MSDILMPALMLLGIMSALFLLGVLLNRARVRRWELRADSQGHAVCRDCGHKGTLSYGLLAGKLVTSANIRLICAGCGSENWYVPGGKRDTGTRNLEKRAG